MQFVSGKLCENPFAAITILTKKYTFFMLDLMDYGKVWGLKKLETNSNNTSDIRILMCQIYTRKWKPNFRIELDSSTPSLSLEAF